MINGVINVYKERGYTSHDVVARLRGILKQKKIGHTGTLDPEAVGVLPVCLGRATKLCELLTDKKKTYEAVLHLGIVTDTQALLEKETDESKLYILRMMERGCYDMNGLINNILDFSKLEAGKFTLELREFEFRGMMDYVKSNHQKLISVTD